MNAPLASGHFATTRSAGLRFRQAGDLTLDRVHHDGRVDDRWIGLLPREFAILWRLAEHPGEPVAGTELTAELWRLRLGYDAFDIAGQVARLEARLVAFGLAGLVAAERGGAYVLAARPARAIPPRPSLLDR